MAPATSYTTETLREEERGANTTRKTKATEKILKNRKETTHKQQTNYKYGEEFGLGALIQPKPASLPPRPPSQIR